MINPDLKIVDRGSAHHFDFCEHFSPLVMEWQKPRISEHFFYMLATNIPRIIPMVNILVPITVGPIDCTVIIGEKRFEELFLDISNKHKVRYRPEIYKLELTLHPFNFYIVRDRAYTYNEIKLMGWPVKIIFPEPKSQQNAKI